MDFMKLYESKVLSADDAIRKIKSGDRVFLTGNCSTPRVLLDALVKYAPEVYNVEICQALTVGPADYVKPEMEGHIRANTMFISANVRQAVQEGRADFTPVLLSEYPLLFKNKVLPLDVALVHLSPPDEHGFCSFGIETGLTKSPAESAKIIIAEINQQMPRALGDAFIHISRVHYIVPTDYALSELLMGSEKPDEVTEKMAGFIADLIPDGATMQLGIGVIPDAVLKYLFEKHDLGIHSELFSDGVIELFERGVLTGARKTIHTGKISAGFIIGSRKLYQWVDDNPLIELHPTEYINNPYVIAQNDRQVAINSAIEVDLTGQVCADSIGPKFFSGVGGQLDFIYGASRSKDGVPIIALPSTATMRDGSTISRIVPMLKQGAGVVTTRNHVRYVVTEFGVASLYGKSIRQRTLELVNIAHPQFRDEILQAAKQLHYV